MWVGENEDRPLIQQFELKLDQRQNSEAHHETYSDKARQNIYLKDKNQKFHFQGHLFIKIISVRMLWKIQ